jgi:hypothetical protein
VRSEVSIEDRRKKTFKKELIFQKQSNTILDPEGNNLTGKTGCRKKRRA